MGKSLSEIQGELRTVIKDMDEVINDLNKFQGIGQEVCIRKIEQFIDDCESAVKKIEYVKIRRKEALVREAQEKQRKLQELENNKSGLC